jgi:large repetitive protein
MLANSRFHRQARRGIVLVLVLAMLGLLALIGVTFATFSGQAKINARNFMMSVYEPQDDELMDFALSQLITDTADVRSAIHGHSLARDMYGSDANGNGYLPYNPTSGGPFSITGITQSSGALYLVTTNIASNDPNFYGYNFTRWIMRVAYIGGLSASSVFSQLQPPAATGTTTEPYTTVSLNANQPATQTFEIIADSQFNSTTNAPRTFTIALNDASTNLINMGYVLPPSVGGVAVGPAASQLPGQYLAAIASNNNGNPSGLFPFSLDGRWLRAFNGPGMAANAYLGNFRYNGLNPSSQGMDEDYDACDLENWFLSLQSADGQVVIPSFHRPGILRYDVRNGTTVANDWQRINQDGTNGASVWASSASRILRPCQADGNDAATFQDLTPSLSTGKITYDVDNDGDGVTDSVWLDLGYPSRTDSRGQLFKPLFAFMVIGLNGRIPLNTAGNLAGQNATTLNPTYAHTQHLGNTVSEIDPTYALQNGFNPFNAANSLGTDFDPFNTVNPNFTWPPSGTIGSNTYSTSNTQVDNSSEVLGTPITYPPGASGASGGLDVRLIQLRNILAGTRPQANPSSPDTTGLINGDTNNVYGAFSGGVNYYIPNSIADFADLPQPATFSYTDPKGNVHPLVVRTTAPVAGRWGEAASVPGVPFANPAGGTGPPLGLVQTSYANPIRAGYSFDVADMLNAITAGTAYDSSGDPIFPRDAADDNYNAFDVFPPRLTGEWGDVDYHDATGSVLLPVERMRRFVTPIDLNGSGRVAQFTNQPPTGGGPIARGSNLGPDNFGRVQFSSYYRPAGAPGVVATNYTYESTTHTYVTTDTATSWNLGAIYYPEVTPPATPQPITPPPTSSPFLYNEPSADPFYSSGPNSAVATVGTAKTSPVYWPTYLPDKTNNPYHGFESYKVPNLLQNPGSASTYPGFNPEQLGGMPVDVNQFIYTTTSGTPPTPTTTTYNLPTAYPTYDNKVNSSGRLDGVNEADEMNLYTPNPLLDSPFGPSDLEWLYRQQDIDGATLTSRLSQLAPISFTNTIDGPRRRRLVALDSWETNNFVWANDNPGNAFPYNSRFGSSQNASMSQTSLNTNNVFATPSLAQRDKKINLNYPLPVSNDCNEPVRQKWINETYHLLKVILPPDSVDTAEELAQLSQYVINIIDFRDPDGTMTHWVNPDVVFTQGTLTVPATATTRAVSTYPTLTLNVGNGNLNQYGMEYNPVAINEVLAYSFQTRATAGSNATTQSNRFYIELVNTLTAAYTPSFDYTTVTDPNNYYANQASALDLGGFTYVTPTGTPPLSDPYGGGCWDIVFTADDGMSRPDPFRGDLVYNPPVSATVPVVNYYGLIPLTRDAFVPIGSTTTAPNGGDPTLIPINPNPPGGANLPTTSPVSLPGSQTGTSQTTPPTTYFYVISNPASAYEYQNGKQGSLSPTSPAPTSTTQFSTSVTQTLQSIYDPMPGAVTTYSGTTGTAVSNSAGSPTILWRQGILPGVTPTPTVAAQGTPPTNFSWKLPLLSLPSSTTGGVGSALYYWVCLRRPANPFAPVSATNPMCVVDSMRFPYIDGTGSTWTNVANGWSVKGAANTIYSAQRLQPYRGGHAVPPPYLTNTGPAGTPPDSRYGYSEQICFPERNTVSGGLLYGAASPSGTTVFPSTPYITFHTLGLPNSAAENWDYLVFNDRDFSSVAELMLVPGCPPGLFTKQFVEFAPSQFNAANIFSVVTPMVTPTFPTSTVTATATPSLPTPLGNPSNASNAFSFAYATAPFMSVSSATPNPTAVTSTTYTAPTAITTVPTFPTTLFAPGAAALAPPAPPPPPSAFSLPSTVPTPVLPHTYPYLVDKFFYTGASTFLYPPLATPSTAFAGPGVAGTTDPSSSSNQPVVGGPAADGWFKMFDFFEVPSQMIGAIGPVAQGNNFDWARQDTKPGLMNPNLIIDEEAFFAVFGRQNSSFTQTFLNGIELPPWPSLPYSLPLTTHVSGGNPIPPIPFNLSPIPLVVSAVQVNGAPNFVYPYTPLNTNSPSVGNGYVAVDPILQAYNTFTYSGNTPPVVPPGVGSRIKAAFAQFLWLRHGGSGYLFGHGGGQTGQNSAVVNGVLNTQPIPADRPFRSLSYPDINYTIMRPAALPPSAPFTNTAYVGGLAYASSPAMIPDNNLPALTPVANAQALMYPPAGTTPTLPPWYFLNSSLGAEPYFYAPYVSTIAANFDVNGVQWPVVYTGDPGVRNPFLSQGFAPSFAAINPASSPYSLYSVATPNSVPAGVPLPINIAMPTLVEGLPSAALHSVVMPQPIPAARLFQAPDAYGAGSMSVYNYNGTLMVPPPVSNATDSGDPWINNQIPNAPTQVINAGGVYALNNGFPSLVWPWIAPTGTIATGQEYGVPTAAGGNAVGTTGNYPYPPNPATGVLPMVGWFNALPASATTDVLPTTAQKLTFGSTSPYLGSVSPNGTQTLTATDDRQHPYWRSEHLQSAMNLTTVRTHQYAVWITVGFFEVKKTGDIGMLAQGTPTLAFDIMGAEVGALSGTSVRYKGFFLVDRTKLTGFNPGASGSFRAAVLYRKVIQ